MGLAMDKLNELVVWLKKAEYENMIILSHIDDSSYGYRLRMSGYREALLEVLNYIEKLGVSVDK